MKALALLRHRLLILCLLLGVASAGVAAERWPLAGPDLKPDPAIRFGALENGMRYAIMPANRPEGEAFLQFYIGAGSLDEREDERGAAHFVEHMAFNGSENIPEDELIRMLQRLGLAFGADANAYTGFDRTVYTLDLPATSERLISTGLLLMRELASRLLLDAAAVDRERGIIQSERRSRQSPRAQAGEAELEFLMAGTRIPARLPIGTPESIEALTAAKLRTFYERHYRPDNAFLVVTGDIDPGDIEARIRQRFSDWKAAGKAPTEPDIGALASTAPATGAYGSDGLPTRASIYNIAPGTAPADSVAARITSIRRGLAIAMFNRRLETLVRSADPPFLGGGFSWSNQNDLADIASLTVITTPGGLDRAVKAIEQEARRAWQYGFTDAELREQIANQRVAVTHEVDNAARRHGKSLANWLIGWYADESIPTHPARNADIFAAATQGLDTEALSALFGSLWRQAPARLFLQGSDATRTRADAALAAYGASRQVAVAPPAEMEDAPFAYTDFGTPGRVVERRADARFGATLVRFENGVRLALKPTKLREKEILARLYFGGGLQSIDPDEAMLASLLQSTFVGGGLKAHSLDTLGHLLAGRTAGPSLSLDSRYFVFSAAVVPDDLLLQMQLWSAYLTAPGYRAEALTLYRRALDAVYETLETTPRQVLSVRGETLLHGGDARYGLPAKAELLAAQTEDLAAFMTPILAASPISVALVGDFDEAAVIAAAARTLGALPARAEIPAERRFDQLRFPPPGRHSFSHKGEADQAIVQMVWPTLDDRESRPGVVLYLLREIIADRLREEIREMLGAAYAPRVTSERTAFPGYGTFSVTVEAEPGVLDTIEAAVNQVIRDIRSGGVDADALNRARAPVLEQLESNLQSNRYWLSRLEQLLHRSADAETYAERRALYQSVTADAIQAAATRYLDPDQVVTIRVIPAAVAAAR